MVPILIALPTLTPVPILIVPLRDGSVPMLRVPLIWFTAISILDALFETSIVFVMSVFLTLAFPDTSKLNDGSSVFTPTKPDPPAAYNDILSLVAAAVESFSIPIVRRPAFVVVPDKSWYFIYA